MEYVCAINQSVPLISFWAVDHLCLFSWPLPLPKDVSRAAFCKDPFGGQICVKLRIRKIVPINAYPAKLPVPMLSGRV
jgi:hypothetical protein